MSSENVESARRANAALNAGDIGTASSFFAEDAELRDLANAPDQATVVEGVDAIRRTWELWASEFDDFPAEVEEWIDEGDALIARTHWQGRGKASGASIDVRQFDLYEIRDGKCVRATLGFKSLEEARRG